MLDDSVKTLWLDDSTRGPETIPMHALKDEYVELALAWAMLSHNTELRALDAGGDYMIIEAGTYQQGSQFIVMTDFEGTDKHYVNVDMFNKLVVKAYEKRCDTPET